MQSTLEHIHCNRGCSSIAAAVLPLSDVPLCSKLAGADHMILQHACTVVTSWYRCSGQPGHFPKQPAEGGNEKPGMEQLHQAEANVLLEHMKMFSCLKWAAHNRQEPPSQAPDANLCHTSLVTLYCS